MSLVVHTAYLRGYADQIEGECHGALATVSAYHLAYCADGEGLDGLLAVAREAVHSQARAFTTLIDGAGHGLTLTAYDLRRTAGDYDRSDAASADRLWLDGRTWQLPAGYREVDPATVSSGFSTGASLNLVVPAPRHDAQSAKESVYSLLGTVNTIVKWVTGRDLLAEAMPIVFGEWGDLRRIAAGYDEVERAFDLIAQDLTDGMDCLSPHWTGDPGGASTAFDYHLRQRWIPGFRALANAANAAQQTCEWMADAYEYVVNAFLLALNFYARRIVGAYRALCVAVSPLAFWYRLHQLVSGLVGLVTDTIRMIYQQTKAFGAAVEMMVANLTFMFDLARGDFAVFRQA